MGTSKPCCGVAAATADLNYLLFKAQRWAVTKTQFFVLQQAA